MRDFPDRLRRELNLESAAQEVVFTQIGTVGFRDAIRFENGVELLLQCLTVGQSIRVLSLASEHDDNGAKLREQTSPIYARSGADGNSTLPR